MTFRTRPARNLGGLALILMAAWMAGGGVGRAAANAPALDPAALAKLSPLERAERMLPALEDAETRGVLRSSTSSWSLTMKRSDMVELALSTQAEVDSLLRLEPRDPRTNLICARFGRVVFELLGSPVDSTGKPQYSEQAFTAYSRALDRALAVEPSNPELYYWKARFCSTVVPHYTEDSYEMETLGPLEAVTLAQRAVELAPSNERYRTTLALCLFSTGKLDEAAEVMHVVRGGRHPLERLIRDWKAVPVPPRAERFDTDPADLRSALAARGLDYATARIRCYSISADAATVEKFYRGTFPGFQLFAERPSAIGFKTYTCFLRWQDRALVPAEDAQQHGMDSVDAAGSGLLVRITEFRGDDALKLAHVYDPIGDTVCWIYLLDLRATGEH